MSEGWAFAIFAAVVVAVIAAVIGVVMFASYHVDKTACANFGRESHREVKFVRYTLVSWDCLTPTRDGRWISTHNLREFDGE